ncbi:MAG: isochorismatase family protein [Phycisphaerae bacterium]
MTKSAKRDVFVDLCIQREYLAENGPRRCQNAEQVALNVKHVMAFARLAKVPVLSCVDVNRANRIGSEFVPVVSREAPQEQKAAFTLLPHHTVVESDNSLCVPLDVLQRYQQAIFTKVHRDPFTNPKLDRLLTEMPARRFIVFGIPLETSLRILVLGLLRRRRRVTLLTDACGYWNRQEAQMVVRQLGVKGCKLTTANEYLSSALALIARRLKIRIRASRSVA